MACRNRAGAYRKRAPEAGESGRRAVAGQLGVFACAQAWGRGRVAAGVRVCLRGEDRYAALLICAPRSAWG